MNVNRSGGELPLQGGAEPGRDPDVAQPPGQPGGLGVDRGRSLATGVLEQPHGDLAIGTLRPAAHDPAVPPDARADVAGPVEQRGAVLTEVPAAFLPAHRALVQGRQQCRPWWRRLDGFQIGGEYEPGGTVHVDLRGPDRGEGLLDVTPPPSRPPLQI